jgi:hypothetical protein
MPVDATTFTISIVSRGSTIRFLLTCWFIKAKLESLERKRR